MLSPKPLDEIQPNLVCELLTCMGRATANCYWLHPLGPWEGSKVRISFNFNFKVNFKDVCVLSLTKDTKIYQTRFSFCHLGHAVGAQGVFFQM